MSLVALIIGQVFVAMGILFAYVSVIEIASIIFNERQNQIFIGCQFVLPFLITIFSVVFPPFVSRTLGYEKTIFMITQKVGVIISIFC